MSSLRSYVLGASVFVAVATGCSTTDQDAPGGTGGGGSSGTSSGGQPPFGGSGGLSGSGGTFTAGTGGSAVAGTSGSAVAGTSGSGTGGSTAGTGGSAVAGTSGSGAGSGGSTAGTGGSAVAGMGGSSANGGAGGRGGASTGGASGTAGQTNTGGSGGGAPVPGCGKTSSPKGARNLTIQLNGTARTYVLFVPSGYDATKSIPLIFAWHSSGADGAESRRYYRLEPVTGDGAIIVYPNGLNGGWDLAAEGVDVKLFDALLASISSDYCVDSSRVFSTGYSFGGMMSHSLACSRGSKLRAFAPMAGAFLRGVPSSGCATPVPGWIAHATNDSLVSFSSGQAARDVWLKTNGCSTTTMPTSPSPCVAYQCSKAPVVWCSHTEGHEWPSFASRGVWSFFSSL